MGLLLALAGVAALVNWFAVYRRDKRLEYVAKPATTALLLGAAIAGDANEWVVVALALCLAGDVFLMLPRDLFVPGLASFLLGHVAFIAAFVQEPAEHPLWGVTAAIAAVALALSAGPVLRGATFEDRRLRLPVLAYMAVIGLMMTTSGETGNGLAIAGAATFMLSDSILARNRFVAAMRHGHLATMVTYHAALALLVVGLTR